MLEAMILLGNGFINNHSLLSASYEEMIRNNEIRSDSHSELGNDEQCSSFSVFSEIDGLETIETIAVRYQDEKKIFAINDQELKKIPAELKSKIINFIWLTPTLELLFLGPKNNRRDYLDKIVSGFDIEHPAHLRKYQKLQRERLLILEKNSDPSWLNIVEQQLAEIGTRIALARAEAVELFNKAIDSFSSAFPKVKLKIEGEFESEIKRESSAIVLEEIYKRTLVASRDRDSKTFRTSFGIHRSDLNATLVHKNCAASLASTGEQKLIMISVTLACAKLSAVYKNRPTILVFDEALSHLDAANRMLLLQEIAATNLQTFFTLASEELIPTQFDRGDLELIRL